MVSNLALLTVTSLLVTVHACRGAAGVVQVQWRARLPACPRGASRGKMLQARLHIAVYTVQLYPVVLPPREYPGLLVLTFYRAKVLA